LSDSSGFVNLARFGEMFRAIIKKGITNLFGITLNLS
jgi:hypothetical protein